MKIAFYAPIKPPDHPIASGDRLIARNLVAALSLAGHTVEIVSKFIAYSKHPQNDVLAQRKADALIEAENLISRLKAHPPDCWITYHPYCKAPDWIGPLVCPRLAIPYVTVEAARTGQGFEHGGDLWKQWRKEAQAGICAADLHLCFKPTDRSYLTQLIDNEDKLVMIPPFIDTVMRADSEPAPLPNHWRPDWPVLMTAGMMRPGKKAENYRLMAEALSQIQALPWNLLAVGGGPEKDRIAHFFKDIDPARLHFAGAVDHHIVLALMKAADIFVWPGWKEPIGMVYLEAQLCGLPVCALDSMGVSLVVSHGKTGLLAPENDLSRFRKNLAEMISHPDLRRDFAANGPGHVEQNHSLTAASAAIDTALLRLKTGHDPAPISR